MGLILWSHPFAAFCQKALIALYETGLHFEVRLVDLGDPASAAAFRALWPLARMPVLVDDERGLTLPESRAPVERGVQHVAGQQAAAGEEHRADDGQADRGGRHDAHEHFVASLHPWR